MTGSHEFGFLAATAGVLILSAALCDGTTPTQDTARPSWPTKAWQISNPEQEGMDSKELAAVVDWGIFTLDSLLVTRHGKIVVEAYYAPYAAGIPHVINSCTKAVISTLAAIAYKESLLDNPNQRVLQFFGNHEIANLDSRKEAITVQNLLDMTSGIAWSELGQEDDPTASTSQMERSPDWVKFVLDRPMSSAPGATFNYDSGNAHLLSAILAKLTGMSALEYAKTKLFGPLGIKDACWEQDPQSISIGGHGLWLKPRDMAKIGYLYLHGGVWEGQQLLPSVWIEKVNHATIDVHQGPALRYSNCFWAFPEKHIYMAVGYRGQVIMVFSDLDVVAVTTGHYGFSLSEFADLISGSVKSAETLPSDPADAKLLANRIIDVSKEKPTPVGPASKLAGSISGKVYRFPPNPIHVKSISLMLTDPQPSYDIEVYPIHPTEPTRFTGPIGLDGRYREGEPTYIQSLGVRAINAVKGSWLDDDTFLIDRLILGLGRVQKWTLRFSGEKLNVSLNVGTGAEISIDGGTGG
jgi:CubicO group peptidase (beta-lactamase class C family)